MMHGDRRWQVQDVTRETLVEKLTSVVWCCCQGFRVDGMLWLNDSFEGATTQEFAVVRIADGAQFESVTTSWCSRERLEALVEEYARELDQVEALFDWRLQPASLSHGEGPCPLCA